MNAIEIKGLTKKFGKFTAIDNLYLSIPKNRIFGLLGPNGAGKTTLINILTGLLLSDAGEIKILGLDVRKDIEKIRENIALVPQTLSLYENLTIYENLEFFGGIYIKDKRELKKKIEEIIKIFRLEEKKDIQIYKLSGGYQRRCSFACALISNPKILFLDEPLTGIDIYTNKLIMGFINSMKGITIIITTHSIKEVETLCDKIVFVDKGKKVIEGNPREIIKEASKYFGEKVIIETNTDLEAEEVKRYLEKAGFKIEKIETKKDKISFVSKNLGTRIVEVINALSKFRKYIKNIDIEKPDLESLFTYIIEKMQENENK